MIGDLQLVPWNLAPVSDTTSRNQGWLKGVPDPLPIKAAVTMVPRC